MWYTLILVLLLAFLCTAQNVTISPDDARVQYTGTGWQKVDTKGCGKSSQVAVTTKNAGDSVALRFQGARQITVFGLTSINGAKVQFNLDSISATVDLSFVGNEGVHSCFPMFTASNLSALDDHKLTVTHMGVGSNANLQGLGVLSYTQVVLSSVQFPNEVADSSTSPETSNLIDLRPSSTTQMSVSSITPLPIPSFTTKQPSEATSDKPGANFGLIVGTILMLLTFAILFVLGYFFWRKGNRHIAQIPATPIVKSFDPSIGGPDVPGAIEKQTIDEGKDLGLFYKKKSILEVIPRRTVNPQSRWPPTDAPGLHGEFPSNLPPWTENRLESIDTTSKLTPGVSGNAEETMSPLATMVKSLKEVDFASAGGSLRGSQELLSTTMAKGARDLPPPQTPQPLTRPGSIPRSLIPGIWGSPLSKLVIPASPPVPSSPSAEKNRPVSTASWRTVGTPYTPYVGVISFVTRQVMKAEQPQFSWREPGTLERGKTP